MSEQIHDLISLLVAFLSLVVAAWVARLTNRQWRDARRHAEMSVRPAVNIRFQWGDEREFSGLSISNDGLGPAGVTRLTATFEGRFIEASNPWAEIAERVGFDVNSFVWECFDSEEWAPGYVLNLFGLMRGDSDAGRIKQLIEIVHSLHLSVEVRDLYDNPMKSAVFDGRQEIDLGSYPFPK